MGLSASSGGGDEFIKRWADQKCHLTFYFENKERFFFKDMSTRSAIWFWFENKKIKKWAVPSNFYPCHPSYLYMAMTKVKTFFILTTQCLILFYVKIHLIHSDEWHKEKYEWYKSTNHDILSYLIFSYLCYPTISFLPPSYYPPSIHLLLFLYPPTTYPHTNLRQST